MKTVEVDYILNGQLDTKTIPARVHGDFAICRPLIYNGTVELANKGWVIIYVPYKSKITSVAKIGDAKKMLPKLKKLFKNFDGRLVKNKWVLGKDFRTKLEAL